MYTKKQPHNYIAENIYFHKANNNLATNILTNSLE